MTPAQLEEIRARAAATRAMKDGTGIPWLRSYGVPELLDDVDTLAAEVERLTKERDDSRAGLLVCVDALVESNAELIAQVALLRARWAAEAKAGPE